MNLSFLIGPLAACVALSSCATRRAPAPESLPDPSPPVIIPARESWRDWSLDDLARFYAGLPTPGGSFAELESLPFWREHAAAFDSEWRGVSTGPRHPRARQWAQSELRSRIPMVPVIYYLFGGADFLTADLLFPDAREIYLAGLEPVGEAPSPFTMSGETLAFALDNLRYSLQGLLRQGFSETKDLRANLTRTPLKGVKPLLLVSIARTGHQVLASHEFPIGSARAVEIEFRRAGFQTVRRLTYIQGDLSNSGDPRILDFLSRRRPAGAYLKAASYLMHEESFSRVRRFLLGSSEFILQDDSGVPLRAFDPARWDLCFYGNYTGVMPLFRKYYQPELHEIYRTPGAATPLSFGLGYRYRDDEACQILAVRRY